MPFSKYPPADSKFELESTKQNIFPKPKEINSLETKEVNIWLLCHIAMWEEEKYIDKVLWQVYRKDFNSWIIEVFERGHPNLIYRFWEYLQSWGVFLL